MSDVTTSAADTKGRRAVEARLPSMVSATTSRRVAALAVLLVALWFGPPSLLGSFWLDISMLAVVYSAVTLGLGLLVGRVGMYSLCQVPLLAFGAWIALRLSFLWHIPFPLYLVGAGVGTGLIGMVIGIPALRLSGLYLALITLMGAGALTLFLSINKFPNGGNGFFGYDKKLFTATVVLARPALAHSDVAYYRYCIIIVALLFVLVTWHIKGRPGRAWASIRQSEVTAVAAGVNTPVLKLWAFGLSAFVTGVAGGLLAAAPGGVTIKQFPIEQSITLLAVVMMGGVYNIWGAVVAAFFLRVLPQILDEKLGVSSEFLTILFGLGVMQVVILQPAGVVEDLRLLGLKLGGMFGRARRRSTVEGGAP
jgi:branched-chain amino acid transport system permease protein